MFETFTVDTTLSLTRCPSCRRSSRVAEITTGADGPDRHVRCLDCGAMWYLRLAGGEWVHRKTVVREGGGSSL